MHKAPLFFLIGSVLTSITFAIASASSLLSVFVFIAGGIGAAVLDLKMPNSRHD
jgi:hypothetical protein